MPDSKPHPLNGFSLIALMAVAFMAVPAVAGALPEDYQRYVINLKETDHAAGGEVALHLNYQDGRFLQGWVYVDGQPVESRVDVSQLALGLKQANTLPSHRPDMLSAKGAVDRSPAIAG